MADEPGSGGSSKRKVALVAGFGLIGLGAYQLSKGRSTTTTTTTTPTTGGKRLALNSWLGTCRADIVAAIQQGRWLDVLGQYLREYWSDFLSRADVVGAGGAWDVIEGQWLRENAPSFWARGDIQSAWPARVTDVIGQFLKENGALNCPGAIGLAGTGAGSASGSGSGSGSSGGTAPGGGGLLPISAANAVLPGYIISTGCGWNQADYLVISDRAGVGRIWIKDYATWSHLGASRGAIRLVTVGVLYALRDLGTLSWANGAWGFNSSAVIALWPSGLSLPPTVITSNAGYCS